MYLKYLIKCNETQTQKFKYSTEAYSGRLLFWLFSCELYCGSWFPLALGWLAHSFTGWHWVPALCLPLLTALVIVKEAVSIWIRVDVILKSRKEKEHAHRLRHLRAGAWLPAQQHGYVGDQGSPNPPLRGLITPQEIFRSLRHSIVVRGNSKLQDPKKRVNWEEENWQTS